MNAKFSKFFIKILVGFLVLTNLYKFRLINAGYMTEPDERRYLMAWSALKHLMHGDFYGFSSAVFSAQGRPGEILLKMIPASMQFITAKIFDLDFFETRNFYVVFVYNFIIYGLIIWLLYKIYLLVFQHRDLALFGVLVYTLLLNSYVYLRHLYPYDASLLLFLFVLYRLLRLYFDKKKIAPKEAFLLGGLSFFAFLVYPAYNLSFMALFGVFLFVLFQSSHKKFKRTSFVVLTYIFGSISILLFFELFSRLGGKSFIHNALRLSTTVTQGDFWDTPTFIFKYLIAVEGFLGYVFLIIFVLGIFMLYRLIRGKKHSDKVLLAVLLSYTFFYLLYVVLGYYFYAVTLYARILHQFFPIWILLILYVISNIKILYRYILMLSIVMLATAFFFVQMQHYLNISYPRDVYWSYLRSYPRQQIIEISEDSQSWSNLPQKIYRYSDKISDDSIISINTFYFFPMDSSTLYHPFQPKSNQKKIFDKLHFLNFKAYQFEGYKRKSRKLIDSLQLHIKLYKTF